MDAPLRRRRLVTLVAATVAAAVVGLVTILSAKAGAAGPGPVPAQVVVPRASTVHAVSGPLAAAANAGDPAAIGAPGTEGSDGTTAGGDPGVDGSSASDGLTAPSTDSNAADDPEGQFGATDSSGTVLAPNPPGSTDPSLGMTP